MSTQSDKPKLWPEGLHLFRAHWLGWLQGAAWFVLALIPADAWSIREVSKFYKAVMQGIQNGQDLTVLAQTIPQPNSLTNVATISISIASLYFFCTYFLARSPILTAPKLSLHGFLRTIGRILQKYLIILLATLPGWLLIAGFSAVALHMKLAPIVVAAASAVIMAVTLCGGIYIFCRYTLVYPLASNGVAEPLKVSAALTKGNIGRIIWGYTVLTTVMLPPSLVIMIVPTIAPSGMASSIELATFMALSQALIMGLFASFYCATFDILYREKQAADPSFKLLAST